MECRDPSKKVLFLAQFQVLVSAATNFLLLVAYVAAFIIYCVYSTLQRTSFATTDCYHATDNDSLNHSLCF